MSENKNIFFVIGIVLAVLVFYKFGGIFSVSFHSESNQLTNYTDIQCNLLTGPCVTEAQLNVPNNVNNVTFHIAQDLMPCTADDISNLQVEYYAFNYESNVYEKIYDRTFNVPTDSAYYMTGAGIYNSSTIIKLDAVDIDGYWRTQYYACLPGMESQLPPTKERDTYGYHYECLYPGQFYNDRDYDQSYEGRIFEISTQYFLDSKYIKNNVIKFKIESSQSTTTCSPDKMNDFWLGYAFYGMKPEEEQTYYEFKNNTCLNISGYPSEKQVNWFETYNECTGLILHDNNVSSNSSNVTNNSSNSTELVVTEVVCPSVCIPVYQLTGDVCLLNTCGPGCGPDDKLTYKTKALCESHLSKKTFFEVYGIPFNILIIIVITGILIFFWRKKNG